MKARKTVLLSLIGVLACIYIIQLIVTNQPAVQEYKLTTRPDTITFTSKENGTVTLAEENGSWVTGDKKYPVDTTTAESILTDIQQIKSLGIVSKSVSDGIDERYGLNDDAKITVTATKDGKTLRTISVGKMSMTGSQTYIRIGSSSNTLLASGSLHNDFNKTVDTLRTHTVYSVKSADITSVSVDLGTESYTLTHSGTPAVWELKEGSATGNAQKAGTIDNDKVSSWISLISNLNVTDWAKDTESVPEKKDGKLTIATTGKTITVSVAKIGTGDNAKYLCTSSETPYPFYISEYTAERYTKELKTITK